MKHSKKEAAKTKIRMIEMRKRKEAPLVPDSTVLTPRKVFSFAQALGKAMSQVNRALPKS